MLCMFIITAFIRNDDTKNYKVKRRIRGEWNI